MMEHPEQHEIVSKPGSETGDPYADVQLPLGDPNAIRLLEILPSRSLERTDEISCVLRRGTLDQPYVALSYTWKIPAPLDGWIAEPPPKTILFNGLPTLVSRNLWDFLNQEQITQVRDGSRLLWIDALCIRQLSIAERNHQVAMMGQIYTKASHVVV